MLRWVDTVLRDAARSLRSPASSLAVVLAACVWLSGCATSPREGPIVIGYLGGLSSRASSLGVAGRDGALLAVEQANAAGGIRGREVSLEVADDAAGATATVEGVLHLAGRGALAVIGPMTSGSAIAAVPVADRLRLPLLSPTVSTDDLSGVDDEFLRIYPTNNGAASRLASEVVSRFGRARVAVVYDLGNRSHTETWYRHFEERLERLGGRICVVRTFTSGRNPDFTDLARAAIDADSECVFVLSNAIDSAMLIQRLRIEGSKAHVVASEWSSTDDILAAGGRAVEGMLFLQTYDRASRAPEFGAMVVAFRKRFGYVPGFAAVHAYDATRMALAAAAKEPRRDRMKSSLLSLGSFPGVQGAIRFDANGDVEREYVVMTVRDGEFIRADRP